MDAVTIGVAFAATFLTSVCALLGLWLRLRWRVRHEQIQGRHLTQLTAALNHGGQVEVNEERGEGRRLTMTVIRWGPETQQGKKAMP
ncbi:hypothetical protein [Nonomuraea maritima]|uniref:hypothetical protein n=1 Tax=Nonomuraea maritima TaxID=683260 RepID=UPI003712A215